MRTFAVLAALAVCALSSQGVARGQSNSTRPDTILWTRKSYEQYANRDTLYAQDKMGNPVTVSLKEPSSSLLPFLTSFTVKNYKSYIQFHLYTRLNKNDSQILYLDNTTSIDQSNYMKGKKTIVIIHGYLNDVNSPMVQLVKDEILKRFNYNIIGVDWRGIIENEWFYWQVANDAEPVGRYVGDFIVYLMTNRYLNISQLYLVGHSLGAHAAGFAGKQITLFTNETVPRLSGLDPALPGFRDARPEKRLALTDATFVDCIHTCGGYLAYSTPICHADFYPNGGFLQPGCSTLDDIVGICSHSRAYEYYAESIQKGHLFYTYKCIKLPEFKTPVRCIKSSALMGFPADLEHSGVFYLKTNSEYAFSFMDLNGNKSHKTT